MSVKKFLILSAAGIATLATSAAFAGGPDMPPPPQDSGVYIEAQLGYSYENWEDVYDGVAVVTGDKNGGFTVGGDIGYQINNFWAIEFGGMYVVNGPRINGDEFNDWFVYLGPKIMVPLDQWVDNLTFFMKAGVAYRSVEFTGGNFDYWRPMFAGGFQYMFAGNWIVDLQYMFVPGSNRNVSLSPDIHQFTVSFGYRFSM